MFRYLKEWKNGKTHCKLFLNDYNIVATIILLQKYLINVNLNIVN